MADQYMKIMEQIDKEIGRVGTELENLIVTKKTMELMYQRMVRAGAPVKRLVHDATHVQKKERKKSTPNPQAWRDTRERVIELLTNGPMITKDIIASILTGGKPYTKSERDRVYGVLKELRDQKKVTLHEHMNTLLTATEQASEWEKQS